MSGEIPSTIQTITPDITTVSLANTRYTEGARLFPTMEATEHFFMDFWVLLRELSTKQKYHLKPQVVVLDFSQIERMAADRARVGLAPVLGSSATMDGGPFYLIYDNVVDTEEEDNPWESLGTMLKRNRKYRAGISRREGGLSDYEIIGHQGHAETFRNLLKQGSWVSSSDFPNSGEELGVMHAQGLLFRTRRGRHRYYHTPVGFD